MDWRAMAPFPGGPNAQTGGFGFPMASDPTTAALVKGALRDELTASLANYMRQAQGMPGVAPQSGLVPQGALAEPPDPTAPLPPATGGALSRMDALANDPRVVRGFGGLPDPRRGAGPRMDPAGFARGLREAYGASPPPYGTRLELPPWLRGRNVATEVEGTFERSPEMGGRGYPRGALAAAEAATGAATELAPGPLTEPETAPADTPIAFEGDAPLSPTGFEATFEATGEGTEPAAAEKPDSGLGFDFDSLLKAFAEQPDDAKADPAGGAPLTLDKRDLLHLGLGMMVAASKPGATLLGSLGAGGIAALTGKTKREEKRLAAALKQAEMRQERLLKLADLQIKAAEAAMRSADRAEDRAERRRHNEALEDLRKEQNAISIALLDVREGQAQAADDKAFASTLTDLLKQNEALIFAGKPPISFEEAWKQAAQLHPTARGARVLALKEALDVRQRQLEEALAARRQELGLTEADLAAPDKLTGAKKAAYAEYLKSLDKAKQIAAQENEKLVQRFGSVGKRGAASETGLR